MAEPTMRAPRAPSLRSLVKYALKCQSAEELGQGRPPQRRRRGRARQAAVRTHSVVLRALNLDLTGVVGWRTYNLL
jgi:hypothetical protein